MYPYWNQLSVIYANINRYVFFTSFKKNKELLNARFPNVRDEQIYYIPFGSDIQKEDIAQDKNISFIGSCFFITSMLANLLEYKSTHFDASFTAFISDIKANPFITMEELLLKNQALQGTVGYNFFNECSQDTRFTSWFSGEDRIVTLYTLSSLGLYIYGNDSWLNIGRALPSLVLCFNAVPTYSVKHNQDIYNSSKICINHLHAQAKYAYSWRVHDIMASNACLISEESCAIKERFATYVEIPMFSNAYEAYELSTKLLKDEVWRKDIVLASQEIIEKEYRWIHSIQKMEEALGIDFQPKKKNSNKKGSVRAIMPRVRTGTVIDTSIALLLKKTVV